MQLTGDRSCEGPLLGNNLVSVLVPTYNRAHLIGQTLDSIAEQNWRPIEIIVVDDGSTDGTGEVVAEWNAQHEHDSDLVLTFRCQDNAGAPVARNRGFRLSCGQFIQFLDSDDLLHPDKLRDQVRALMRNPQADFAFSRWEYFGEKMPGYQPCWAEDFRPERDHLINLMLQENRRHYLPLHTGSTLYRRNFCRRLGKWDEGLRCYQDVVYNTRALLRARHFCYVPRVQMLARRTGGEHISGGIASEEKANSVILGLHRIRETLQDNGCLTVHRRFLIGKALFFLAWGAFAGGAERAGRRAIRQSVAICPASSMRILAALTRWASALGATACAPALQTLWKRVPDGLKRAIKW